MTFPSLYLNELVLCTCLNTQKVKLRHRLDFSSDSEQTMSLIKIQCHNLNKVFHSTNELHDMSRIVEYLFLLVQRYVGTDCFQK